jgi:hypothetical protein
LAEGRKAFDVVGPETMLHALDITQSEEGGPGRGPRIAVDQCNAEFGGGWNSKIRHERKVGHPRLGGKEPVQVRVMREARNDATRFHTRHQVEEFVIVDISRLVDGGILVCDGP